MMPVPSGYGDLPLITVSCCPDVVTIFDLDLRCQVENRNPTLYSYPLKKFWFRCGLLTTFPWSGNRG